jgi:hypothetical protein
MLLCRSPPTSLSTVLDEGRSTVQWGFDPVGRDGDVKGPTWVTVHTGGSHDAYSCSGGLPLSKGPTIQMTRWARREVMGAGLKPPRRHSRDIGYADSKVRGIGQGTFPIEAQNNRLARKAVIALKAIDLGNRQPETS